MATLVFGEGFKCPKERRIFQKMFKFSCNQLQIATYDTSIYLNTMQTEPSLGGRMCYIDNSTILLDINTNQPTSRKFSAFCHELVHCKQHLRGEMDHIGDGKVLFKGKLYDAEHMLDENGGMNGIRPEDAEKYLNTPWEIEAFGRMQDLADGAALTLDVGDLDYLRGIMIAEMVAHGIEIPKIDPDMARKARAAVQERLRKREFV